jgi:hypothetical protein
MKYPEDDRRFLQALRERTLRERIAQAKASLGSLPSQETLLGESHAARIHRRAIQTLARLEATLDAVEAVPQQRTLAERRKVIQRAKEILRGR